jgi:hypothetical protein
MPKPEKKPRLIRPTRSTHEDKELARQMMQAQRFNQLPKQIRDAIFSKPVRPLRTSTFEEQ